MYGEDDYTSGLLEDEDAGYLSYALPQTAEPSFMDFFGAGDQARSMNAQGYSDPRGAAWAQALSNIAQMNMGGIPNQTPFGAANDVRRQNAVMMEARFRSIQDNMRYREGRRLRDLQAEIAENTLKQEKEKVPNPYSEMPQDYQLWKLSNSKKPFEEWAADYKASTNSASLPADVQTYLFAQSLPPDQQKEFLGGRFAPVPVKVGDVTYLVNKGTGAGTAIGPDGMQDFDDINHVIQAAAQNKAEATAKGTALGTTEGTKLATSATDTLNADYMVSTMNKVLEHPGREAATGGTSILNGVAIPGSDRANFLALMEQVKGQGFIQAFQSIKGAGPITDTEGAKATVAQQRLNEAQSEEAFVDAVKEAISLIEARKALIPKKDDDEDLGSTDGY